MRWKLKTKADHKDGTERIITKYAVFPKALDDNYQVWLERYYVNQRYYIWDRKGRWRDQRTWSESTEKRKFLNSIKDSENYVQDGMDSQKYTNAKRAAAKVLKSRSRTY